MKKVLLTALTGLVALGTASAQSTGNPVADCLIQNSTPEIESNMKMFMLAALQDDKITASAEVQKMGINIVTLAQTACAVTTEQMSSPEFAAASELYGAWLGEVVMTKAMESVM